MGQFVQTNGDYSIKTAESGTITLDTGFGVGNVRITGNLLVEGDSLTVSAENLNIQDNVIILNDGETGAGVTLRYSGIQVDRGTLQPVSLIYDDNDETWNFATGSPESALSFARNDVTSTDGSRVRLREITTNADTNSGDLDISVGNTGIIKIVSSGGNYDQRVIDSADDDAIPNKKYVDDAIRDNPTFQIVDDNTRVLVTDVDVAGSVNYFNNNTAYTYTESTSSVSVLLDGTLFAQFFNNRLELGNLEIGGGENNNEITSKNGITNENIFIRTQGTGRLQTNYAIEIEKLGLDPASASNAITVYGKNQGSGDSGVYFVNSDGNGELVSKNRALLFSMIF